MSATLHDVTYHNTFPPDCFHFSWLLPDHFQILWLFQVFQLGDHPANNTSNSWQLQQHVSSSWLFTAVLSLEMQLHSAWCCFGHSTVTNDRRRQEAENNTDRTIISAINICQQDAVDRVILAILICIEKWKIIQNKYLTTVEDVVFYNK